MLPHPHSGGRRELARSTSRRQKSVLPHTEGVRWHNTGPDDPLAAVVRVEMASGSSNLRVRRRGTLGIGLANDAVAAVVLGGIEAIVGTLDQRLGRVPRAEPRATQGHGGGP